MENKENSKEIISTKELQQIIPTKEAFVGRVGDLVLTMLATQAIVVTAHGLGMLTKATIKGVKKGCSFVKDHFKKEDSPEESSDEEEN